MRGEVPPRAMLAKDTNLSSAVGLALDDEWAMEQKLDGHRIVALVTDGYVEAFNRQGQPYTKGFPRAARELMLEHFRVGDIIDGELVGQEFWAFDALRTGTREMLELEQLQRRAHLRHRGYPHTLPCARTSEDKAILMRRVRDESGEGIIVKHIHAPYEPGIRSKNMLKAKYVKTVDCVVTELERNGKTAIGLGLFGEQGLVEVGSCSMIGKAAVDVGDVVEVRYLYAVNPKTPRLTQPTFLSTRDDKDPTECTLDQLHYTNKAVLL